MKLLFKKLHPKAIIPKYQSDGAAGFDLHAIEFVRLNSDRGVVLVRTGLAVELPEPIPLKIYGSDFLESLGCAAERQTVSFELQIRPRSSMAKKGVIIPNSPGTIDSDYRGEILIPMRLLHGNRREQQRDRYEDERVWQCYICDIQEGERIAQGIVNMIVVPEIAEVETLSETIRGEGGFGSTGNGP
jgi:dUTP pyrophosphatase